MRKTEEGIRIASEKNYPFWLSYGTVLRGWSLVHMHSSQEGLAMMETLREAFIKMAGSHFHLYFTILLAEAYWQLKDMENARSVLEDGLEIFSYTKEVFYAPELFRIKGLILQEQGEPLTKLSRVSLLLSN